MAALYTSMPTYPFDVRATAQALFILTQFAEITPGNAREIARVLTNFADDSDAADAQVAGNVRLAEEGGM